MAEEEEERLLLRPRALSASRLFSFAWNKTLPNKKNKNTRESINKSDTK